jgi:hypothetical protein
VPIATGTAELVRPPGDPNGVTLYVNGAESSHHDVADPSRLEFEYMQQMSAVLDHTHGPGTPVRAVHLGGGACSLARALDATRPGSRQIAVEIDPVLAACAREWFQLPRAPRLRIRVADAREAVASLRAWSQDVVVRDVFRHHDVPDHVRTTGFTALVARALGEAGVYLANCVATPRPLDVRREVATLQGVFPHVGVVAEPGVLKGRRYGNIVLIGSRAPLPGTGLVRDLLRLAFPVSLLVDEDAGRFAGAAAPYEDDAAPSDDDP